MTTLSFWVKDILIVIALSSETVTVNIKKVENEDEGALVQTAISYKRRGSGLIYIKRQVGVNMYIALHRRESEPVLLTECC